MPRTEAADVAGHRGQGLSRLDAALPGLERGTGCSELLRNGPRGRVTELMAGEAAIGLDDVEPLGLALHLRRDAVLARLVPVPGKALAGESAAWRTSGWPDSTPPPRPRPARPSPSDRAGGRAAPSPSASPPGRSRAPRRRSSPPADRDEVPPARVRHDDLRHPGRQIGGLGDDPDAGLRPARAGHDAGKVGRAGPQRVLRHWLRPRPGEAERKAPAEGQEGAPTRNPGLSHRRSSLRRPTWPDRDGVPAAGMPRQDAGLGQDHRHRPRTVRPTTTWTQRLCSPTSGKPSTRC